MSLDDKIRAALKKDKKKLNEAPGRWDPDSQPNIYELSNFLRKSGYRLVDILVSKDSDLHEILLEPVNPGYLYPEISHDIKEGIFYIKVINYGMLEASDVEGVIQGYENALAVVRHLESLDLSKFEIDDEEDEE